MKRILFYCMLPLILFACKKDNKPAPQPPKTGTKTYAVNFNVSANGLSSLTTNSLRNATAAAPVPVSTYANKLYYWVYNSSGTLITRLLQDSTTSSFGQISDTFSPGTYTIIMVAQRQNPFLLFSKNSLMPPPTATGHIVLNQGDTFYDRFTLTVASSPITQDVTLTRVDAQLQIKITDSIPVAATSISVQIIKDDSLNLVTGLPAGQLKTASLITVPLPDSVKDKTNYTITTYIENTTTPFTVVIGAINAIGATFVTQTVDSVTCSINTRTLLTGALFTSGNNNTFNITFNDTWDNPVIVPFVKRSSPTVQQIKQSTHN